MSAATIITEAYGEGACLYETVLGVTKDASPSALRKAYYKKCLAYHPDKLSSDLSDDEREVARAKFNAISIAYTILSDVDKRKEYDDSGDLYDDDDDLTSSKTGYDQWREYFDNIFPKVTEADINAFEVKYKCSDEEEQDVIKYYSRFKGDLNKMLECVMLSSDADKCRWVDDYIKPAIERGDVDDYMAKIEKTIGNGATKKSGGRNKMNDDKKKKKIEQKTTMKGGDDESDGDTPIASVVEASSEEAEMPSNKSKNKRKSSKSSSTTKSKKATSSTVADDDLAAQILSRRKDGFDSMMAGLEERYGGGGDKKKKKGGSSNSKKRQPTEDVMDDDEFAKIQAKILMSKKGS